MPTLISRMTAAWVLVFSATALYGADLRPEPLPNTAALSWTDDISIRIVDEAHQLLDRKTAESVAARQKLWTRDLSSPAAYEKSIESNRQRFRKILGVVEPRVAVVMDRFGDEDNPAAVAETPLYRVWQVRWTVLEGIHGEGLLLEPKAAAVGHVVAIGDADQTPEQLVGLAPGVPAESQFARRLAESGFRVVVPVLVSRSCEFSGNRRIRMTNQPHREWIYRQAFEMGRHVIGYEVEKVLAAVDWFERTAGREARPGDCPNFRGGAGENGTVPFSQKTRIGVAGYGEGGLLALYAAAADVRIQACLVSGYFGPREALWEEPIYRNVWRLLAEFGDAEIAALVAPRRLVIEHAEAPRVDGPPAPARGRSGGAAPGRLVTPSADAVQAEARRTASLLEGKLPGPVCVVEAELQPMRPGPKSATARFMQDLAGQPGIPSLAAAVPQDARKKLDVEARQKHQVEELAEHVQRLQRDSDHVRDEFFLKKVYGKGCEAFVEGAKPYREHFRRETIGWIDDELTPPRPQTRRIYDEPAWTGYEVVLEVWPGLHAWGILCLPKNVAPGEKRPAVVCQHGLEGVPRDVVERTGRGFQYYKAFAAELAQQGFVTFAPFNLYRGQDRFRSLQRKANPLGLSLFSLIIPQHEQIVRWLGTLPQVDRSRIAFYGLSYGGKTAMRVPALVEGYCLSICSGDFNDWVRKNVSIEFPGSYMFTGEYEIFEWNLGGTFNYAEMAYLIFPRPFMVERGHHDGVGIDPWVAYEYAKVRWLYANLGLGDRTQIEYFNGPHAIHGVGTYEFLRAQMNWLGK